MIFLIDGQILETDEIDRPISTYFKNVLYNLIAGTAGNIWYIAVSSAQSVAKLDPWLAGRLNVLEDSCFAPSTDYSHADAYTDRINEIVAEHNVDVFWSPNPLMVDVLCPNKKINCQHFATVWNFRFCGGRLIIPALPCHRGSGCPPCAAKSFSCLLNDILDKKLRHGINL